MASKVSRGSYYKKKTQAYYEKLGYETQITEFMCGRQIAPNKIIYVKKDVFSSDGISMNGKEIIFWNSKHTLTGDTAMEKWRGSLAFNKHKFPDCVKRQLVIWQPRQKQPTIINVQENAPKNTETTR